MAQLITLIDLTLLLAIALILRAKAGLLRVWTGGIIDAVAGVHATSTRIASAISIARPWLAWMPIVLAALVIILLASKLAASRHDECVGISATTRVPRSFLRHFVPARNR
ncbi:MAG: hypothetical protein ACREQX_12010 [Candidatus Binataceae bacterium]